MKPLKIFVSLLVTTVFVTAGSAFAGGDRPLFVDKVNQSEESMTGSLEQVVGAGPFFEDRYEDFLYETEKGLVARSPEAAQRLYGIQPSWDGCE